MLRGQKKIDANLAKIVRAEENIVKWQDEIKGTRERMGTPKYMADPFQAHLERLPQDVLVGLHRPDQADLDLGIAGGVQRVVQQRQE